MENFQIPISEISKYKRINLISRLKTKFQN